MNALNDWCDDRYIALEKYGHISEWDTSRVTCMKKLFHGKKYFNDDISKWNVSNVTNMYRMFYGAESFNRNLSNWNVNNVDYCIDFSFNTPQWTLPQPNFTNCNP